MPEMKANFRIDQELHMQFAAVCKELGITATTAYKLFTKFVVQERRLPSELLEEVPSADDEVGTETDSSLETRPTLDEVLTKALEAMEDEEPAVVQQESAEGAELPNFQGIAQEFGEDFAKVLARTHGQEWP